MSRKLNLNSNPDSKVDSNQGDDKNQESSLSSVVEECQRWIKILEFEKQQFEIFRLQRQIKKLATIVHEREEEILPISGLFSISEETADDVDDNSQEQTATTNTNTS